MSPLKIAALAGLLALPVACQSPDARVASGPAASAASAFDREFVTNAYQIILFDREEGRMAQAEADDPEVRALAAQLVRQADEFDRRLAPIAASLGIAPPTTLDRERRLRLGHMRLQRGLDFDMTYLDDQIASHRDVLNEQQQLLGQPGGDPRLVALSREGTQLVDVNFEKLRDLRRRMMTRRR